MLRQFLLYLSAQQQLFRFIRRNRLARYFASRFVPGETLDDAVVVVRRLLREQRSFESLTPEEWRAHSPLFDADVREAVTAAASVTRKRTPQSTHPQSVSAALAETRDWLAAAQR